VLEALAPCSALLANVSLPRQLAGAAAAAQDESDEWMFEAGFPVTVAGTVPALHRTSLILQRYLWL
jgi:hypothetical protein